MPGDIPLHVFPILGIALIIFFLIYCLSEARRIKLIEKK